MRYVPVGVRGTRSERGLSSNRAGDRTGEGAESRLESRLVISDFGSLHGAAFCGLAPAARRTISTLLGLAHAVDAAYVCELVVRNGVAECAECAFVRDPDDARLAAGGRVGCVFVFENPR